MEWECTLQTLNGARVVRIIKKVIDNGTRPIEKTYYSDKESCTPPYE